MLVSYFYPVSGNCITIAVMRKKEFTQTFHKLLTALAVFDNIFIASAIFTLAIRLLKVINIILFGCCRTFSLLDNPKFWFLIPMFLPMIILGSFAMISSMYLTLAIRWHRNKSFLIQCLDVVGLSIERFIGVCYPLHSRTRVQRGPFVYILPVVIGRL